MTPGEPQGCVDVFFGGRGGGGRGTTHDEIDVAVPSNLQRYLARKVFFPFYLSDSICLGFFS